MFKSRFGLCNKVEAAPDPRLGELGRRDFFFRCGRGLGGLALSHMLHQDGFFAATAPSNPLASKAGHFPAKAKSCIFLFMYGAPSQMDTFDPKPILTKYHGTPITRIYGSLEKRIYVGSP